MVELAVDNLTYRQTNIIGKNDVIFDEKCDFLCLSVSPCSAKHQLGEVANETSVGYENMLGIFCAKKFENRTILTKVTVKNVGATFF